LKHSLDQPGGRASAERVDPSRRISTPLSSFKLVHLRNCTAPDPHRPTVHHPVTCHRPGTRPADSDPTPLSHVPHVPRANVPLESHAYRDSGRPAVRTVTGAGETTRPTRSFPVRPCLDCGLRVRGLRRRGRDRMRGPEPAHGATGCRGGRARTRTRRARGIRGGRNRSKSDRLRLWDFHACAAPPPARPESPPPATGATRPGGPFSKSIDSPGSRPVGRRPQDGAGRWRWWRRWPSLEHDVAAGGGGVDDGGAGGAAAAARLEHLLAAAGQGVFALRRRHPLPHAAPPPAAAAPGGGGGGGGEGVALDP
jgi:hypothetical protein